MAVDLIADLAHVAAGGALLPPSQYRALVQQQATESLPEPDEDGVWYLSDDRTTTIREEAIAARAAASMRYHAGVQDFVGSLDLSRFPGDTPLKQALSAVGLLGKMEGGSVTSDGTVPIFDTCPFAEGIATDMHKAIALADSLGSDELSMLYPGGCRHSGELRAVAIAKDLVPGSKLRIMLEVSRKIDAFSTMRPQSDKRLVADANGDQVHYRSIDSLTELMNLSGSGWSLHQAAPYYWEYLAVSGQLNVRERVTEKQRRQAIFILVDCSGSMGGERFWKAGGVVMNRLKGVLHGDAIVWVGVYDTRLKGVKYAETPEHARGMMREFSGGSFSGGGTDTGAAIKAAHAFIQTEMEKGRALWKPDIVVLTDEDASVTGVTATDIPGTRVHGFAIGARNPKLVKLARSTGGIGIDDM
jgi:hypothetical protein